MAEQEQLPDRNAIAYCTKSGEWFDDINDQLPEKRPWLQVSMMMMMMTLVMLIMMMMQR